MKHWPPLALIAPQALTAASRSVNGPAWRRNSGPELVSVRSTCGLSRGQGARIALPADRPRPGSGRSRSAPRPAAAGRRRHRRAEARRGLAAAGSARARRCGPGRWRRVGCGRRDGRRERASAGADAAAVDAPAECAQPAPAALRPSIWPAAGCWRAGAGRCRLRSRGAAQSERGGGGSLVTGGSTVGRSRTVGWPASSADRAPRAAASASAPPVEPATGAAGDGLGAALSQPVRSVSAIRRPARSPPAQRAVFGGSSRSTRGFSPCWPQHASRCSNWRWRPRGRRGRRAPAGTAPHRPGSAAAHRRCRAGPEIGIADHAAERREHDDPQQQDEPAAALPAAPVGLHRPPWHPAPAATPLRAPCGAAQCISSTGRTPIRPRPWRARCAPPRSIASRARVSSGVVGEQEAQARLLLAARPQRVERAGRGPAGRRRPGAARTAGPHPRPRAETTPSRAAAPARPDRRAGRDRPSGSSSASSPMPSSRALRNTEQIRAWAYWT